MFAVPPNTVALDAQLAVAHPARVAMLVAADRNRWGHLLRYDPDQRWTHRIDVTDYHEVWLMSWLPNQRTELHDHAGATGAFTVVSGVLTERVTKVSVHGQPLDEMHTLTIGQTRVFGPHYVHEVANEGQDPAISVHVFSPGRQGMFRYRMDYRVGPVLD